MYVALESSSIVLDSHGQSPFVTTWAIWLRETVTMHSAHTLMSCAWCPCGCRFLSAGGAHAHFWHPKIWQPSTANTHHTTAA